MGPLTTDFSMSRFSSLNPGVLHTVTRTSCTTDGAGREKDTKCVLLLFPDPFLMLFLDTT